MTRATLPLALAALSLFSLPAQAQNETLTPSYLDLYYIALADLEIDDFEFDDGDGYGAKGRFMILDNLFISGEYQNSEYDPFDRETGGVLGGATRFEVEVESYRGGLGFYFGDSPFFVMGEYIGFEAEVSTTGEEDDEEGLGDDLDETGYGAHAGIDGTFGTGFGFHAQGGYVDLGDAGDGLELLGGVSYSFNPGIGLFADYRYTQLEDDVETDLADARVGLRISFR
ncbi:MAG: outer membrane protein [Panacagrimonas sp.]